MLKALVLILMAASGTVDIQLPWRYTARDYQIPFLRAMDGGCKRAALVWHRRAGKDLTALQWAIKASAQRSGGYYYYFPTASLGRKIIWEGKDNDGFRFLDYFPPESIVRKNDTEMLIETIWGSHFRIVGTDNLDVVGTNPVGTVWSEYALQDPKAWSLVQPILRANDGWAVFCYTPRGRNHGYDLWKIANANRGEWFAQLLTIDDTKAIRREEVEADIRAGVISRPLAEQEYWCDFTLGQEGSYYGALLQQAEREGRVGQYPWVTTAKVYRFADFGTMYTYGLDAQFIQGRIRLIGEYWDNQGLGAQAFTRAMQAQPYTWGGEHFAGPDMERSNARSFQTGMTTRDVLAGLGYRFRSVEPHRVEDGIEACRTIWPVLEVDRVSCPIFLQAANGYRAAINRSLTTEAMPVYKANEVDSWECHPMDAFRHLAMAYKYTSIDGQYIGDEKPIAAAYAGVGGTSAYENWGRFAGRSRHGA